MSHQSHPAIALVGREHFRLLRAAEVPGGFMDRNAPRGDQDLPCLNPR